MSLEGVRLVRPVAASFGRQAALERFLAEAARGYTVAAGVVAPGREAVLVATGARSSAGYAVDVLGVREERSRIVVSARELTPSIGSSAATLTFPYRLITIPAAGKHVEVEWQGRP